MLISVKFKDEFVSAVQRQIAERGDCEIDEDTLQKVLESTGNFLARLTALEERQLLATWYMHSVDAMKDF